MRREFSRTTKALAFQRANGKCEGCDAKLTVGKYEYDHTNPNGLSGDNSADNCCVLCRVCHRAKTKDDVGRIAKAKRQEARYIGAHKAKQPFRGWKRMDGTAVRNPNYGR